MDKDLFKKLTNEQPLTAEEALRLDSALEGGASKQASEAVGALPDEALSLAWRSSLNQKLASVSRKRKAVAVWRIGAATTMVAAASVFVLSLVQIDNDPKGPAERYVEKEPTLADAILSEHEDAMGNASLGVYVSFEEPGS